MAPFKSSLARSATTTFRTVLEIEIHLGLRGFNSESENRRNNPFSASGGTQLLHLVMDTRYHVFTTDTPSPT